MKCFVIVREESPGQFTAWPAGIPELKVTAESRERALALLRCQLVAWQREGVLNTLELPECWIPKDDADKPLSDEQMHEEYLNEIRRLRKEADEREGIWDVDPNDLEGIKRLEEARKARQEELKGTIWDYELPCPPISSTPNT